MSYVVSQRVAEHVLLAQLF